MIPISKFNGSSFFDELHVYYLPVSVANVFLSRFFTYSHNGIIFNPAMAKQRQPENSKNKNLKCSESVAFHFDFRFEISTDCKLLDFDWLIHPNADFVFFHFCM